MKSCIIDHQAKNNINKTRDVAAKDGRRRRESKEKGRRSPRSMQECSCVRGMIMKKHIVLYVYKMTFERSGDDAQGAGPALFPLDLQARPRGAQDRPVCRSHIARNLPNRSPPQSSLSTELRLQRDGIGVVVRDDLPALP